MIQRNKIQPLPISRDSRGVEFFIGARIAFNRSGDIKIGFIKEIKKNIWKRSYGDDYWRLDFEMIIENEDGKLSTIKNPNSFVLV